MKSQEEILAGMDEAAEAARLELAELIVQYPEAAEAFGKWGATHYPDAGYKRLMKQIVSLG